MGLPIERDFSTRGTVLKIFPYKGLECLVPQSMVTTADANGKKIVKAGTPFPANDATALGVLLHDVDVTQGDAAGTYVFEGVLDPVKLTANGITIADAALEAMPKITIYETPYGA